MDDDSVKVENENSKIQNLEKSSPAEIPLEFEVETLDGGDMFSPKPFPSQIEKVLHGLISAQLLRYADLTPLKWIASEILPVGLTLLGGTPKAGKSLIALDLAISVASGRPFLEKYEVQKGKILYLTYEDTDRRLQKRLVEKLTTAADLDVNDLHFHQSWPSMSHGGVGMIEEAVSRMGGVSLVVIDTLAYFVDDGVKSTYSAQYQAMADLSKLANKLDVALLVLTHTTKEKPKKWKQALYGSQGMTGGADTLYLLDREENATSGMLMVAGRDIEEQAIPVELVGSSWCVAEAADDEESEVEGRSGQREVYQALKDAGMPLRVKEIAERTGKKSQNVSNMLRAMTSQGLLQKFTADATPRYAVSAGVEPGTEQ